MILDDDKKLLDGMCYADGLVFLVNDRFICRLVHAAYKGKEHDNCWSPAKRDSNCPRLSSYCELVVFDKDKREKLVGQMSKDHDVDLKDPESFTLFVRHEDNNKWEMSTNVVIIEFLES